MNKQIEEMTKIIWDNPNMYDLPSAEDVAFELYNADYRKASEVAREIFSEIEKYLIPHRLGAFNCIYLNDVLAELKKKYESEGVDDENCV